MLKKTRQLAFWTTVPAALLSFTFSEAVARPDQSAARTAQMRHACAVTLGLNPATDPYDKCVRVLERDLAQADQAKSLQNERLACLRQGLISNTPEFNVCVVKAENEQQDFTISSRSPAQQ